MDINYKALINALMYGNIIKASYYKMIPQTRSIKKKKTFIRCESVHQNLHLCYELTLLCG